MMSAGLSGLITMSVPNPALTRASNGWRVFLKQPPYRLVYEEVFENYFLPLDLPSPSFLLKPLG